MYEDKSKKGLNIEWKPLLIKLGILLVALFIGIFVISLFNKKDNKPKPSNLAQNLETMQSAAYDYFTGSRLPETINGKKSITLQEMFDSKLLIEFKDQNNKACNTTESFAEATKINDENYTIKVKLVCGEEQDYVIDTVTIKSNNTIVDEPNTSEDPDVIGSNNNTNDNTNNNSTNNNNNTTNNNGNNNNNVVANNKEISVNSIYIDYKKIYLYVGNSKTVKAIVFPKNATNKTVTWSSSNKNIATVNNGKVTGVGAGVAIITASSGGKSTTMEVVVKKVTTTVVNKPSTNTNTNTNTNNNTSTNTNTITCQYGSKNYLNSNTVAYLIPGNCAVSKDDYYEAKYANPASNLGVTEYQKLQAEVAALEAKTNADLYVEAPHYSAVYNKANTGLVGYEMLFTVKMRIPYSTKTVYQYLLDQNGKRVTIVDLRDTIKAVDKTVNVDKITLNVSNKSLYVGDTFNLQATITPFNATNKTVTWSSNNKSVATVSSIGIVTAKKAGVATITAKASGKVATVKITVVNKTVDVTSITLNTTVKNLYVGDTFNLIATVNPSNATNKTVTWSSSNESVATVNKGRVIAKKAGVTTIKAEASGKVATAVITVLDKTVNVTSITLNTNISNLYVGDTFNLIATILPYNATNKMVTWRSSNENVATVDQNGHVMAKGVGNAIVVAKASNGMQALARIIVTENPNALRYCKKHFEDVYEVRNVFAQDFIGKKSYHLDGYTVGFKTKYTNIIGSLTYNLNEFEYQAAYDYISKAYPATRLTAKSASDLQLHSLRIDNFAPIITHKNSDANTVYFKYEANLFNLDNIMGTSANQYGQYYLPVRVRLVSVDYNDCISTTNPSLYENNINYLRVN